MQSRSWFFIVIISLLAGLLIAGGTTFIVDPYFHYRAPINGLSYSVENADYANDGISRNFEYEAMITGPSTTTGFKVKEANELFGKQFIRITFLGEGFYRIGQNVRRAIEYNDNLEMIFWSIDPIWFVTNEKWEGRESYPEYLLNDNRWDDVNYLLNGQIFFNDTIPEIVRTMKGVLPDNIDQYADCTEGNREIVLSNYQRSEKLNCAVSDEETNVMKDELRKNIEENIVSVVKENPDIVFNLYIPPLSILWWDELNQSGEALLMRRIDMEQLVIELLVLYENVQLFSFEDATQIVCDLDNYYDTVHFSNTVSSFMLSEMKKGNHLLTKDNYMDYLEGIRKFYSSYDYDQLFGEK